MSHYEPLWPRAYLLWPTLTNHNPFWATMMQRIPNEPRWANMVQHLIYFILPQNGVGYLSIFLFCETSRCFILNKTWLKKVFKSASSEIDKLLPQITCGGLGSGTSKFFVVNDTWYMQVFRDANSTFNIFLHSAKNIFG